MGLGFIVSLVFGVIWFYLGRGGCLCLFFGVFCLFSFVSGFCLVLFVCVCFGFVVLFCFFYFPHIIRKIGILGMFQSSDVSVVFPCIQT